MVPDSKIRHNNPEQQDVRSPWTASSVYKVSSACLSGVIEEWPELKVVPRAIEPAKSLQIVLDGSSVNMACEFEPQSTLVKPS